MGFGYLAIGYLLTFVLYIPAELLKIGGFAFLVGYGAMLWGLLRLVTFQKSFSFALYVQVPLLATGIYDAIASLSGLFGWNFPIFAGTFDTVMDWVKFFLLLFFNLSMLYGIRMIAKDVELPRLASAAVRNSIFVGGYALVYLLSELPILNLKPYLGVSVNLLQIVWIACNLFLLVTCAKDICAEGDEDQTPKRYKWEFLNRIGDAYESNRTRAIEKVKSEAEERLRKKQEARKRKKIHHKKKK